MFVGGAGGTATLTQRIPLLAPSGAALPAGTTFALSALVRRVRHEPRVGRRTVPVGGQPPPWWSAHAVDPKAELTAAHGLRRRAVSGRSPQRRDPRRSSIRLVTSLTNEDGYYAPLVGYNHAIADDVRLTLSAPARPAALAPPVVHVPRFDHVFLYFFENQDYRKIVGNTKLAPYFNSLIPHGSLLADTFAEEHPSDGNYLAIAGGSTFGIPLTDPLEEDPRFTVNARNLGDLIGAAHESWKDYAQGANGPCDDTVHGSY